MHEITGHGGLVTSLCFSESGDRLFSLSGEPDEGGCLAIWDWSSWTTAVGQVTFQRKPRWMALSEDSQWLLVAQEGGEVWIWRTYQR